MAEKNPGACPAAASDMLRIVAACHGLGIYTDFDVSYKAPILPNDTNCISTHASIILPLIAKHKMSFNISNNDFLAIPNPDSPDVKLLKESFIAAYHTPMTFRYEHLGVSHELSDDYDEKTQTAFKTQSQIRCFQHTVLSSLSRIIGAECLNPIQLRQKIHKMTDKEYAGHLKRIIELYFENDASHITPEARYFLNETYLSIQHFEYGFPLDLPPTLTRIQLTMSTVFVTTGNIAIERCIFQSRFIPHDTADHDRILAHSSYTYKDLHTHLSTSLCQLMAHCKVNPYDLVDRHNPHTIQNEDVGRAMVCGVTAQDTSWVESGKERLDSCHSQLMNMMKSYLDTRVSKQLLRTATQCVKACPGGKTSVLFTLSVLSRQSAPKLPTPVNQTAAH